MNQQDRVGLVGLGNMGREIADCLAEQGRSLLVGDANEAALVEFLALHPACEPLGARWDEIDVLILVLPNSDVVDTVVEGAMPFLRRGTLVVDMSSSIPARSRLLAEKLGSQGCDFVDAPVSGGVVGARERRLSVLMGGSEPNVRRVQELVGACAKSLIHVGDVGAGHAAKALNNLVSAGGLSLTVEAIRAAEAFGIAPEQMLAVLNGSSGRTNTSESKVAQFMFSGSYGAGFSQHFMTKDIEIAIGLMTALGQTGEVSRSVREQWVDASRRVDGTADHTEMYRLI